jgi:hypothetical protein
MLWLLAFVAALVVGLVLWRYVVGWGLEEPVPPPELVAAVTSAVGTNAHTIRLTLLKAQPGQVELERRRLQDPSTFAFF